MRQEIEKTVKTLPFIPGKSVWSVWSAQFLARAFNKGSRDVLLGNEVPPTESAVISDTDVNKDEKLRKRKANTQAYQDLMLCFSDIVNFTLIKSSMTTSLPNGDAAMAWKKLMNKHEPSTTANKSTLIQKFYDSKLTKAEKDPDEWIAKLELIQAKLAVMKHTITDDQLMVHIIHSIYVSEYDGILDQLQTEFDSATGTKPDLNAVKDCLRNKYNRIKRKFKNHKEEDDDSEEEESNETALYAGGKKFKGQCTHCGIWGHKSVDCRDKKSDKPTYGENKNTSEGKTRFPFKCYNCGKVGHRASKRRNKKKNYNNKNVSESANTAKDSGNKNKNNKNEETMFICEECNLVTSTTYNANMLIGDTGASSNMTNSLNGIINIIDINTEVKMGDGRIVKATKKGLFQGTVMQKDGKTTSVNFQVKYVPDLHCNLLSITTAIRNGAKLSNEGEVIVLKKNDVVLKFDHMTKAGDGNTMSMCIEPKINNNKTKDLPENANYAASNLNRKAMDINDLHRLFGHMNEINVSTVV